MSLDVLKQEAADKNTSPERLRELAGMNDELAILVAGNPFAETSLLEKLLIKDRKTSNTEMQRMLASNPIIPRKLMYKLLELPDISINFLKAASQVEQSVGILNIIANHPKTPKDVLEKLAENSVPFVAEAAKLHINYAGEMETRWREDAESKINRNQLPSLENEEGIELRLWQIGAIDETTLPYLDQDLVNNQINSILLSIICSADTSKTTLNILKNNPNISQSIRGCIAWIEERERIFLDVFSQNMPIDITKQFNNIAINQINSEASDFDDLLLKIDDISWCQKRRWISIVNPSIYVCSTHIFQKQRGFGYRRWDLQNMLRDFASGMYSKYPLGLLGFSNLEYYGRILASNPITPVEILAQILAHPSYQVRVLIASHHNTDINSLNKLINDSHAEVRAAALANPKLDATLKKQLEKLENPNLSSLNLLELADSKHTAVRYKVALHPNVDGSILTKLAKDKLIVRLAVAKNPKTPSEILTRFAEHPDKRLPLAVAQNIGAPKDLLIKLATQPIRKQKGFNFNPLNLASIKTLLNQEPEAAVIFLYRCLKFPAQPSFARFLILMNPQIHSSFLARYYKSWFWPERYAIAQNPNTDRTIRQQLAQDPNRIVRAAARELIIDPDTPTSFSFVRS